MEEPVTVEITDVSDRGTSTTITYAVTNRSDAPVWLVNDDWFVWRQKDSDVEISFARGPMRKGTQVFGYFPPQTVEIPPGGRIEKQFTLHWPQRLSRIWNEAEAAERPPGRFRLSVRVGYGLTPEPEPPKRGEGVEEPVLRWQKEAASPPVEIG
ncbi:MAG: hypothetical protein EPO39_01755 [Candidatus Manganitrophaceae bacterium]|nr:MAG: hypothetical protein EPO39_01755 [Candidatus Manganitrophaceae bacterium]